MRTGMRFQVRRDVTECEFQFHFEFRKLVKTIKPCWHCSFSVTNMGEPKCEEKKLAVPENSTQSNVPVDITSRINSKSFSMSDSFRLRV